jgi:hypothetical protein
MQTCPSLPNIIAVRSFQSHSVYNCSPRPRSAAQMLRSFNCYQSNEICGRQGTYSSAPAATLATTSVNPVALRSGINTPCTAPHSAPRLSPCYADPQCRQLTITNGGSGVPIFVSRDSIVRPRLLHNASRLSGTTLVPCFAKVPIQIQPWPR